MPAGGLAQVGVKVRFASAVRLSPHLRQAARLPNNQTAKNQKYIPQAGQKKGAKNTPPTAGTGKNDKPTEQTKKTLKTNH
jgi:hypothetical protein